MTTLSRRFTTQPGHFLAHFLKCRLAPVFSLILFLMVFSVSSAFAEELKPGPTKAVNQDSKDEDIPESTFANQSSNIAAASQTVLTIEWEPVDGAAAYDVELAPKEAGETIRFSTQNSKVTLRVPIGTYLLRIRSQDRANKFYGDWSAPTQIEALSKTIQPLMPADGQELSSTAERREHVDFKWTEAADAREYSLKIWSDDEKKKSEFKTQRALFGMSLVTGRVYHWQVSFSSKTLVNYQTDPPIFTFTLLGRQLLTPEFRARDFKPFVTTALWSASPGAQTYQALLYKRYLDEDNWLPVQSLKSSPNPEWHLGKLSPGAYRLEVIARADHRASSETGTYEFVVKPTGQDLRRALERASLN